MIAAALSLLAPILLGQSAGAAQAEAARLNACIEKIDRNAEEAYEDGLKWLYEGNRPPARQCTAMALIELGRQQKKSDLTAEGAARLEELANAKDGGDLDQRGIYLVQAGNAWILADRPEAAVVTLSNAMKLRPQDADLWKDRARAYVMMRKWPEAGKDLDTAISLSPGGDPEAYRLRAQVRLEDGRIADAGADIKMARRLAPRDVAVAVMRGRIVEARRLKGLPDDPGL
jgi:tetratricopeptide (TPR) repeat protein